MLNETAARTATGLLLKSRGDHRRLDRLPPDCAPETVEDGMTIQNALAELWGLEVAGWKVGAQMRYAVHDRDGRPIAMLGFSTAVRKHAPRNRFIGWTPELRERNLPLVIDNPSS